MIYTIILNWKGALDTINCVESVLRHQHKNNFRIIIIDNHSPDSSYENIRDHFTSKKTKSFIAHDHPSSAQVPTHDITLVKNKSNTGYAGGNNVGISLAMLDESCQYCWILNNDTEVADFALDALVQKCASDSQIGVCGSKLVKFNSRNHLQGLGGRFNSWIARPSTVAADLPINQNFDKLDIVNKIDYLIGASLLIKTDALKSIGLLSEEYFLYCEEIDFAYRLRGKFKQAIALDSVVFHKVGASTGGTGALATYHMVRSKIIFTRKYHKFKLPIVKAYILLAALIKFRKKNLPAFQAVIQALREKHV